jgi:hypothetical protein
MVQALINIDENTNKVLNIVKAKYDLKDKSETVRFIVNRYLEETNEPELRPEFAQKILAMEKHKAIPITNFGKRFGLRN